MTEPRSVLSWLISVAPPWLAVVLVTHVYFCAVSPFLGVVSVFLVLSDLGSCSWSIYGSCSAFLMGGSRISSQPPALNSHSSRVALSCIGVVWSLTLGLPGEENHLSRQGMNLSVIMVFRDNLSLIVFYDNLFLLSFYDNPFVPSGVFLDNPFVPSGVFRDNPFVLSSVFRDNRLVSSVIIRLVSSVTIRLVSSMTIGLFRLVFSMNFVYYLPLQSFMSSSEDSLLLSCVAVRCLTLSSSVFFYSL
uniref:Uncharacterized protein n=1 Tax=Fagus sylvatica TaxID=28930 RepID=A0A2N9GDF5_FAGSY